MTTVNSSEITLCSDSVGGGPSAFESQWQQWTVQRSLCGLMVLNGGVHLPLSLNDNIEQFRDHSVVWWCWLGGPSAFKSQWQHWTVQRSLCGLTVLTGGVHLPLVSVSLYICTGISLYFLIISWLFWMGSHLCHWTLKISLSALAVSDRGGPSAFGIYILIYTGIFLYVDCFEWVPIDSMEMHSCHFFVKQFRTGGGRSAKVGSSARFELLRVHHHRSFRIYYTKDLINSSQGIFNLRIRGPEADPWFGLGGVLRVLCVSGVQMKITLKY